MNCDLKNVSWCYAVEARFSALTAEQAEGLEIRGQPVREGEDMCGLIYILGKLPKDPRQDKATREKGDKFVDKRLPRDLAPLQDRGIRYRITTRKLFCVPLTDNEDPTKTATDDPRGL